VTAPEIVGPLPIGRCRPSAQARGRCQRLFVDAVECEKPHRGNCGDNTREASGEESFIMGRLAHTQCWLA